MSVMEKVKSIVGLDDTGITTYEYHCNDCDAEYTSAKQPERATCPECVSNDVEMLGRE